jgi:aldose 1-epimerase
VTAPSGSPVEITFGDQRAVIVEVGGGLREYTAGGTAVLDGYAVDEICSGGRGQILVPWPNRIAGGTYDLGGATYHLALTEPDRGNAIHGLGRWANWVVAEAEADRVVMTYRLHPQPGYPFLLDLSATYRLSGGGLGVAIGAMNIGDAPAPYGAGAHPYLMLGDRGVDGLELTIPAGTWYEADERGIPTSKRPVQGSPYDFRRPRAIGATRLDTAFTDLARQPDGRSVVALTDPTTQRTVRLWCDGRFGYLMVFTGDTLGPARRRRAVAVEPMTCAPNAFRSGDGLVMLQPGQAATASWGIIPPLA